jgi:hypothetical protein
VARHTPTGVHHPCLSCTLSPAVVRSTCQVHCCPGHWRAAVLTSHAAPAGAPRSRAQRRPPPRHSSRTRRQKRPRSAGHHPPAPPASPPTRKKQACAQPASRWAARRPRPAHPSPRRGQRGQRPPPPRRGLLPSGPALRAQTLRGARVTQRRLLRASVTRAARRVHSRALRRLRVRTQLRQKALALAVAQHGRLVRVHQPARDAAEQPVAGATGQRQLARKSLRPAPPCMRARLTNLDGTMCGSYCGACSCASHANDAARRQAPRAHLLERLRLRVTRAKLGKLLSAARRLSCRTQRARAASRTSGTAAPRPRAAASCARTGGSEPCRSRHPAPATAAAPPAARAAPCRGSDRRPGARLRARRVAGSPQGGVGVVGGGARVVELTRGCCLLRRGGCVLHRGAALSAHACTARRMLADVDSAASTSQGRHACRPTARASARSSRQDALTASGAPGRRAAPPSRPPQRPRRAP